jgi:hypothetical protein
MPRKIISKQPTDAGEARLSASAQREPDLTRFTELMAVVNPGIDGPQQKEHQREIRKVGQAVAKWVEEAGLDSTPIHKYLAVFNPRVRRDEVYPLLARLRSRSTNEEPHAADNTKHVKRDKETEARDKWIYDQAMKGVAYETIGRNLPQKKRTWPSITKQGARDRAFEYARTHSLPEPRPRQSGE